MRRIYFYTPTRRKRSPLDRYAISFASYCRRRGIEPVRSDPDLVLDYLAWVARVQDLKAGS